MNNKKILTCTICRSELHGNYIATKNPEGTVDRYKVCPKCGIKVCL